jgi:DNA excision repair protein ERCC-2
MEGGKKTEIEKHLFPYPKIREVQKEMIAAVSDSISNGKDIIIHAPTGLGKTAATLSPALKYALDNNKKVFFLTSRHTQHMIAIETLKEIKEKYGTDFIAVDLIGKKWMCTVPGVDKMRAGDFYEYCKKQREDGLCEQHAKTKSGSKLTPEAKLALKTLRRENPCHIERFTELCGKDNLCAHELATTLAKEANVIVADYFYIYNPFIRDPFFKKADISLSDCVVIADEGHNLPDRIRNMMTVQLSNYIIKRAINEVKKIGETEIVSKLSKMQDILNEFSQGMKDGDEKMVLKEEFVDKISKIDDYDSIVADFEFAVQAVREKEKQSSLGSIAMFLEQWRGADTGYARILSQIETRRESLVVLSYRCLDPSIVTQETITDCHSTIIMSGTLTYQTPPPSLQHGTLTCTDG